MTEPIVIEGEFYNRKGITGFYGKKHHKFYSMEACLPPGVELNGKHVRMTIEILDGGNA